MNLFEQIDIQEIIDELAKIDAELVDVLLSPTAYKKTSGTINLSAIARQLKTNSPNVTKRLEQLGITCQRIAIPPPPKKKEPEPPIENNTFPAQEF